MKKCKHKFIKKELSQKQYDNLDSVSWKECIHCGKIKNICVTNQFIQIMDLGFDEVNKNIYKVEKK